MSDILADLNPVQRGAVSVSDGPVLVVAGAGTGKTRVLTSRVAWLLETGRAAPAEILAFTFTNRAAREMRERVVHLVGSGQSPRWIGTFHATGARLLRQDGEAVGVERGFTIYDGDDSLRLIKESLARAGLDAQLYQPQSVRGAISAWKNAAANATEAARDAADPHERKVAEIYGLYEQALRRHNALDFDDLLLRAVHLLAPGTAAQQKYSARFRHVLVDEFQDTNRLQLVMIKALAQVHGNVFAVGDDDQTIYTWRGACLENMLEFEETFPGTRLFRLEQNYRSTGSILAAANAVIAHNRLRKGKNLWTERPVGERVRCQQAADEEDEALQVLDRVRTELARGRSRGDLVVLYRTNAQSRPLEEALRRATVAYQVVGATQFYERREVRDLLAYLKLVANPRDQVAAARILNVPRRRIGDASASRLVALAEASGLTLGETAARPGLLEQELPAAACHRIRLFFDQMTSWRAAEPESRVSTLLERVITETGYLAYLQADDPQSFHDRADNVAELVNAAHAYCEASDDGRLAGFLEQVALVADADALPESGGVVRLMTIHTAKGLEFPIVLVVGCEDGLLPHATNLTDDRALEEERRLFYVAMTRARERAVLLHARQRRRYGQRELCVPSRFLREIPDELLEWSELASPSPPHLARAIPRLDEGDARAWRAAARGVGTGRMLGGAGSPARSPRRGEWDSEFSQLEIAFRVGQAVRHASFGCGVVTRVEGTGDDLVLVIEFEGEGRKQLFAKFAHVVPLD